MLCLRLLRLHWLTQSNPWDQSNPLNRPDHLDHLKRFKSFKMAGVGVGGVGPPGPADAGQALDLSSILGGRACQTAG